MTLGMFVAAILVGLLTGWLAGIVMKDGCYGLGWDLLLGLAGSSAASGSFGAMGVAADAGGIATAIVAFGGAAIAIVAQRKLYAPAPRVATRRR